MKNSDKIQYFFDENYKFKESLIRLREIVKNTPLVEQFKWRAPVYTLDGKNVLGLGRFKNHYGIWFFNGVFIDDPENLLENEKEGKTKALRQLKLTSEDTIDEKQIRRLIDHAIANEKAGKRIAPAKAKNKVPLPEELLRALDSDAALKKSFYGLTPGKQREYAEHIATAKQEATRQRRLQKCIPMILNGTGLHDKYKNCR
ncbi:MAG: YdeI/OmpD-associated family protein [Leeuwenhoekiella sp.]